MVSFRKAQKDFEKQLAQKMAQLALVTQGEVQVNTPVDTGRLRSSIVAEQDPSGNWFIGTTVPYAEQVEVGMKPTVIKPKNKKALYWPGADHPVKKVNHPGFPGSHMFQRAISTIPDNAKKIFK